MIDYYKVLGVSATASREELKTRYHNLILEHHPDKSSNQNKSSFCLIQEAWTVLSDENLRRQHDAEIKAAQIQNSYPVQEEINLSDMHFNFSLRHYNKPCRCGGTFSFDESDICDDSLLLDCDNCSLNIIVNCQDKIS